MTIELVTDRLILRPLAEADFEPYAAMMADPRLAEFLTFDKKPQPRAECLTHFTAMRAYWIIQGFSFFSVFERASGRWVGRVGPWRPPEWPGIECGWAIDPAFWGKGYAPEAAIAAIDWIFAREKDLGRIISLIDPANANSQRVARKIGQARTGETFSLKHLTLDIWAASRDAWLARSARAHPIDA
jgi:RimJ/RimL family protein N-acetyltransferase